MITKEEVAKILEDSINAPSGSNSQPWRFEFLNNELRIIAIPEKDHPILNYRNRGTWIAHGALIENITISSKAHGYTPIFAIFPDKNNKNVTAIFKFENSTKEIEPVFEFIKFRATNRKPYKNTPLSEEQKKVFIESAKKIGGVELKIVEDRDKVKKIAEAASINEIVTLENEQLHKLFFDEIVWSREEEKKRGKGLYIDTMELKPPQRLALKILKKWGVMKIFNTLKFARGIAKGNSKTYASCAAILGVITRNEDKDFIAAGRVMERIWLEATRLGLSFHLMTGTLFFHQSFSADSSNRFSDEHKLLIEKGYNETMKAMDCDNGLVALTFRVGYDGEPSALSIKNPPVIKI